jgi:putative nucleotidyltransferase with HDIG domain
MTVGFRSAFLADPRRLDKLPTLPLVVRHLLDVIDDPLASALDIAYVLREDPPLTARVLRMANSPVYGGRTRIMSVPQAVLRLGMVEIRNVVLSLGVIQAMARFGRRLDYRAFWHHSLTVAIAAETLSRLVPADDPAEDDGAFAAGLLHDIGRLVLDHFYPEAAEAVTVRMEAERLPLCAAERAVLDMDHAEIGGVVASRWSLPEPIVAGVAHHHDEDDAPPGRRHLPRLVRLAEQTCVAHGLGDPVEGIEVAEPTADLKACGLDAAGIAQVVQEAIAGARKSAVLLAVGR